MDQAAAARDPHHSCKNISELTLTKGAWLHLATRLYEVRREAAPLSSGDAFAPAVVLATRQVDDVPLVEGQVVGLRGLVAVQRHHWTQTGSTVVNNSLLPVVLPRRRRSCTFLQVPWGGVGVVVHRRRKWWHDVTKAPIVFQ